MTRPLSRELRSLRELADCHGVLTSYRDASAERSVRASPETLVAVLRALGSPIERPGDAPAALEARRREIGDRWLDPVVIAWTGETRDVILRLPARRARGSVHIEIHLETGEIRRSASASPEGELRRAAGLAGSDTADRPIPLPAGIPPGYHRLRIRMGRARREALLIAAPRKGFIPGGRRHGRMWGVFVPLYAIQSDRSWGAGDLTGLQSLIAWAGERGGGVVGTLPLLACFLDEPFEPSPYSPASRLYWNEFYLDVARLPDLERCADARRMIASTEFEREIAALRASPLVDYRRGMALKRRVLALLARDFFGRATGEREEFERFLRTRPRLRDYARFRAACERRRGSWRTWPVRQRDGTLGPRDYEGSAERYHLYVQWRTDQQMGALSAEARRTGPGLYLDFPLGVHPDGFDVWREGRLFADGASVGAPPDAFFTRGQNWGFPPLHPEEMRRREYAYTIACLRRLMEPAGILRLDHVMGLHRLFWIPRGLDPSGGAYVRYRSEELYAILALESHRNRTLLVGEDLGTVPPQVRPAMARHGVQRSFVVQYEAGPDPDRALPRPPASSLACLNTHDMPTFAAYWRGRDIRDRASLGLLDAAGVRKEMRLRAATTRALVRRLRRDGFLRGRRASRSDVLAACLHRLAAGPARIVIVTLEDLWGEQKPQNTPGTGAERPNWRRKTRYNLERLFRHGNVASVLEGVNRCRKEKSRG